MIEHIRAETNGNRIFGASACPEITDYAASGINNWRDLTTTTAQVRGYLGISPSAYEDALDVFGQENTAVIIACILQRAQHINSAGGYLRALTEKTRAGGVFRRAYADGGAERKMVRIRSWWVQWAGYPPGPGCCSGVVGARLGGASSVEQKASAANSANPMTSARKKRCCVFICFHRLSTVRCASFHPLPTNGT
jgi:hypothetical protein